MKKLLFLLLIVTSVQAADNYLDIPWGISFDEVNGKYELRELINDLLSESNRLYLSKDLARDLSLYVAIDVDEKKPLVIDGRRVINLAFGFHKNKLIYTIMATDLMKYNGEVKEKYGDLVEIVRPDSCKLRWQPIFRAEDPGGSIFNEGGMAALCETDRTYFECQESCGSITNPTFLQYVYFHLDRTFFDELTESPAYKMEDELKAVYPSYKTFTRFITKKDRERSLKLAEDEK